MNVNVQIDEPELVDMAPDLVATECEALARERPVDLEEVVRRVEYGLADAVRGHFECSRIHLSATARRAVVHLLAELLVAQHEHDTREEDEGEEAHG